MNTPWRCTYTGLAFDLLDPQPEQVDLRDIAHALALQCRYSGQCPVHYSVAEHSLRVAAWIEDAGGSPTDVLAGLLHDAAEAYVGDLPGPIKHLPALAAYCAIEARILAAIDRAFAMPALLSPLVQRADAILLATEVRDLFGGEKPRPWELREAPQDARIVPRTAVRAEDRFLAAYGRLQRARGVRVGVTGRAEP